MNCISTAQRTEEGDPVIAHQLCINLPMYVCAIGGTLTGYKREILEVDPIINHVFA